jgi:LCP family protein required for cell wall assembly
MMSSKEMIKKYVVIVAVIIGIFALVAVAAVIVYAAVNNLTPNNEISANNTPSPTWPSNGANNNGGSQNTDGTSPPTARPTQTPNSIWDTILSPPDRTTVLIMGMDAVSFNTDINLLVTLHAPTGVLDVISVPRDMRITIPQSEVERLRQLGRLYIPSTGNMRFGDLHNLAGRTYGPGASVRHLEALFGIEIDHYVVLSLKSFRDMVDLVEGIWFDVPEGGLFYEDPCQDLFINVPGGRQLLNGELAEMVVRYRHSYPRADLDRINVQQAFMREFFVQSLNSPAIRNDFLRYMRTALSSVSSTDIYVGDLTKYVRVIEHMSNNSIFFHTIPGAEAAGGFFAYNSTEGREFLDRIFKR